MAGSKSRRGVWATLLSLGCVCLALVWAALLFTGLSCSPSRPAESEQPWKEWPVAAAVERLATSGQLLTALCTDDQLRVWRWKALDLPPTLRRVESWEAPALNIGRAAAVLKGGQVLTALAQPRGEACRVALLDADGLEITRWDFGNEWEECQKIKNSKTGQYALVWLRENFTNVLKDRSRRDDGDYRLGVVSAGGGEVKWLPPIRVHRDSGGFWGANLSDDGRFVAGVGCWNDGWVVVGDVEKAEILWNKVVHGPEVTVPSKPWTVNFNDCAFSPDGSRLYVAGNTGLFCFDVQTGKILQQWGSEGRLMSVEASPDGRWVATGMAMPGDVFLYDLQTNRLARRIRTGDLAVWVTFSPDSQLLATSGGDNSNSNIKIWKLTP